MPPTQHIGQCFIQLGDGETHLAQQYMDQLISVEVDDSLDLPDMFTIQLKDFGLQALQNDVFKLGTRVKISVRPPADPTPNPPTPATKPLMVGEITSVEPDLNGTDRATLWVRGYDKSHRMNRVRKNTTYQQVKDSDLAQRLASAASLSADVTATSVVYPYLMQANQTDWEFLAGRAKRIGYRLYVENRTLYFKPPPASPPETNLEWGISLAQFRGRLNTVNQVTEVTVRGWDSAAKAAIVATVSSPTASRSTGITQEGGPGAQTAHSIQGKAIVVDQPVVNQTDATKVAQALLDRLSAGYVEAEGQCGGSADVLAGTRVNISGVGARFNGKYLVTRALHVYSAKAGYSTRFWATSGTGSNTITGLLTAQNGHNPSHDGTVARPTERGVMVGIVTNNLDPENQGRVKVKFPTLGDNQESYWCRMASTMAGPVRGIAMLPEANDEVVVAFENGDPTRGVVLGAVWNGSDALPMPTSELVTGGITIRRIIQTRMKHKFLIDDTDTPGGFVIADYTGNNKIIINTQENKIQILANNDIEIKSAQGKVSISALKGVDIQGQTADVTVGTQQNFKVTATAGVDISATGQAKFAGTAGVDISSAAQTKLSGGAGVDITGGPMVQIKGAMVKLN